MPNAKITSKGQVRLPDEVRGRLGLEPGDEIEFVEERDGFCIRKVVNGARVHAYRGYLKRLAGADPDKLIEQARGP